MELLLCLCSSEYCFNNVNGGSVLSVLEMCTCSFKTCQKESFKLCNVKVLFSCCVGRFLNRFMVVAAYLWLSCMWTLTQQPF